MYHDYTARCGACVCSELLSYNCLLSTRFYVTPVTSCLILLVFMYLFNLFLVYLIKLSSQRKWSWPTLWHSPGGNAEKPPTPKKSVKIASLWAGIWTWALPNLQKESYPPIGNILFTITTEPKYLFLLNVKMQFC